MQIIIKKHWRKFVCQCFLIVINDLNDYQLVKFLLTKEYVLQRDLSEKLNAVNGKTTKQSNFSCKLKREHLTYKELRQVCDILGYDLILALKKARKNGLSSRG